MKVPYNTTTQATFNRTVSGAVEVVEREVLGFNVNLRRGGFLVTVLYRHFNENGDVVAQGRRHFTRQQLEAAGFPVIDRMKEIEGLAKIVD